MTRSEKEQQMAKSFGATCVEDRRRGPGWCKFYLGDWTIWVCSRLGSSPYWQCAKLYEERYQFHKPQETLLQALNYCKHQIELEEE